MPRTTRVSSGPRAHFFGYYEKSPWDASDQRLLAHAVDPSLEKALPDEDDPAEIVVIDEQSGESRTVGKTRAWNFQQGAMLQWLGPDYDNQILFNDRDETESQTEDGYVTRIVDLETGSIQTVGAPMYAVAPDGTSAFTLSFGRLSVLRSGYGYAPFAGRPPLEDAPADVGIESLNLETGDRDRLVSLDTLAKTAVHDSMEGATHWVNHIQLSPDGTTVAFLHRWSAPEAAHGRGGRLFVMDADGSNLRMLADAPFDGEVSHYDWRDESTIVGWMYHDEVMAFYEFDTETGGVEPFATDILTENGHNSFGPTGRWMLTDTYADADGIHHLLLYDTDRCEVTEVAQFETPAVSNRDLRCDLHPRWDHAGRKVCVDSRRAGKRDLYVVDISDVVDAP